MGQIVTALTNDDLPQELRQQQSGVVKPRLLKLDPKNVPEVLNWNIIVQPVTVPTETEAGLQIVADTVRHMNLSRRIGVVLAIGPLAYSELRGFPPGYKPIDVGDWVNFHENAGVDTTMIGEDGLVMIKYLVEKDILGKPRNIERHMVLI